MNNYSDKTNRGEIQIRKNVITDVLDNVPEYIKKIQCDTCEW